MDETPGGTSTGGPMLAGVMSERRPSWPSVVGPAALGGGLILLLLGLWGLDWLRIGPSHYIAWTVGRHVDGYLPGVRGSTGGHGLRTLGRAWLIWGDIVVSVLAVLIATMALTRPRRVVDLLGATVACLSAVWLYAAAQALTRTLAFGGGSSLDVGPVVAGTGLLLLAVGLVSHAWRPLRTGRAGGES